MIFIFVTIIFQLMNQQILFTNMEDSQQSEETTLRLPNQRSDAIWNSILTQLNNLDQKKLNQIAFTLKPKHNTIVAFKVLTQLFGQQFYSWSQVSKHIQKNFIKSLYTIKHLMLTGKITSQNIDKAAKLLSTADAEQNQYQSLAKSFVSYCQMYMKENGLESNEPFSNQKQHLMQEELNQIEEEIRIKKQHLQKFLEKAYADDDEEDNPYQTPQKQKHDEETTEAIEHTEAEQADEQSQQLTPKKQSIPLHQNYRCKLQVQVHGPNASVSPISTSSLYMSKIHKKNESAQYKEELSKTQMDIRQQIEEKKKEIRKLQATERQIKWIVDRDAKLVIERQKKQQEAFDLKWSREEALRKEKFEREKQEQDKSFQKENKSFKQLLSSPRTKAINSSIYHKSFVAEEIEDEQKEKCEDQYRSLCSELQMTTKLKEQMQKSIEKTQKVIRKPKIF